MKIFSTITVQRDSYTRLVVSVSMLAAIIFVLQPLVATASTSVGTIDAVSHTALVCHDVTCASPAPGTINFAPTGTTPVTIDDTLGMSGIAWGNEMGWINFHPTGTGGVTINPTTGALMGQAWSQASGWINFSPTGNGVSINAHGEFVGWAWAGGPYGGWIKFDCSIATACVKTDWRPLSARVGPVGNGPPVAPPHTTVSGDGVDLCANLFGFQDRVPTGYVKDAGDICALIVDYCPNIAGVQYIPPAGFRVDVQGNCNAPLKNQKYHKPLATKDTTPDICNNLLDTQDVVPAGYVPDGEGGCVPKVTDYCPNIEGLQYSIPLGRVVDNDGNCISSLSPAHPETTVAPPDTSLQIGGTHMLAYSFVPSSLRIPTGNVLARTVLRAISHLPILGRTVEYGNATDTSINADFVSVIVTLFFALIIMFLLYRLFRLFII